MADRLRSSPVVTKIGLAVASVALLAAAWCMHWTASQEVPLDEWAERVRAGWIGKVAAGSGALPAEMQHRDSIRAKYGELSVPPQEPTSRGPLDDTTLSLLAWQAAREHGPAFTSADIAAEWVEHLPASELQGGGFGSEFLDVLKRLGQGEKPPVRSGTPRAEWIAAQMRAEIWGMLAPGDADRAADYAERDASVFNVGNGIYAAQFVAVLASRLMVDPDIPAAIATGRSHVPDDSDLAKVIDDVLAWREGNPGDWEATWDRFVDKYRDRGIEQDFARWNDEWLVETGGWPDAAVLPDYGGEQTVLRTHPFGEAEPARLTTLVAVPATGGRLKLRVNCNDRPADVDWLMRVKLGETVHEEPVHLIDGHPKWQDFQYDLSPWAGQTLTIVLENAVLNKFGWEAGFWASPRLEDANGGLLHGTRPEGRPYRYPLSFEPMIRPETFSILVGLLYGDGDFRRSVSITTMCGFDTDCNAGTVGCLLGLRDGLDAIPPEWRDPVGDTYELQVAGLPRTWSIAELARQISATAVALAEGRTEVRSTPEAGPAQARNASVVPAPVHPPEGFGASARGGEGGRVIMVTTLADSGPGSLRDALAANGPRTVLFGVEGTIELQTRLRCENGRITIDGGSAPGQGITLLNHGIQFRGDADDIIVRNLRIRVLTGGAEGDCLLFWGNEGGTVERVLVDHCSLMWATDEVVNTWGNARDITVQWTIIAEAQLPHSKAWLSGEGSDRISIHHCLLAHNADRNPKLEGGVYDVANNVIYNWGHNNGAKLERCARVNLVNNCFIPGPDTTAEEGCIFPADVDAGTSVYLEGNIGPHTPDGKGDQWANVTFYEQADGQWVGHRPAPAVFRADDAFFAPAVAMQTALEARDLVLDQAGARIGDADDLRVIGEVRDRTGRAGRG